METNVKRQEIRNMIRSRMENGELSLEPELVEAGEQSNPQPHEHRQRSAAPKKTEAKDTNVGERKGRKSSDGHEPVNSKPQKPGIGQDDFFDAQSGGSSDADE